MSKSKEAILAKSEGKYKALSKKELLSVYLNLPTDNRARCVPERLALIQDIFQQRC